MAGLEVARAARRYAGDLDFGIRARALAGQPERAQSSPECVFIVVCGGAQRSIVYGTSDELGAEVADGVHVHDFHATLLHLLGFDHRRLTFRHAGRDFRLVDVAGNAVQKRIE
jgi:hypothetical protein